MKRLTLITGSIALWSLLVISCYAAVKIIDFKNQSKYEYEYTDINGDKGISKHCFTKNNINVCKVGKHTKRVIKIEKYEV